MDPEETKKLHSRNVEHLSEMANYYSHISPAASRYLMSTADEIVRKKSASTSAPTSGFCDQCGSIYDADNHSVRILPKMKLTNTIRRLLKKQTENGALGLDSNERRLLEDFANTRSRISITCKICKQVHVVECPKKPAKPVVVETLPEVKKKRKKRKKDVTCGLNIPGKKPREDVGATPSSPLTTSVIDTQVSSTSRVMQTPETLAQKQGIVYSPSTSKTFPIVKTVCKDIKPKTPVQNVETHQKQSFLSSNKKKGKQRHSQLQHMLNQDKKSKTPSSSSSLHSFLSGL